MKAKKSSRPKATVKSKLAVSVPDIAVPQQNVGKSLDEFRSIHDKNYIVPKKIKDALSKLGNSWEYEVDFAKISGVSITDLAKFRDQFEDYIVEVKSTTGSHKKNVWAGKVDFAKKLREATT